MKHDDGNGAYADASNNSNARESTMNREEHHPVLKQRAADDATDEQANFGKSQFRGKTDIASHLYRWLVQFLALSLKNLAIVIRRPLQLALFLLLPSVIFMPFLVEESGRGDNNSGDELYPAIPIADLGECDAYYGKDCVQIVYGPTSTLADELMLKISTENDLTLGKDIKGFPSELDAEDYVAENLGKVQFTVFFRNYSIWETSFYSPDMTALDKNMSYVIYFNASRDSDPRSKQYGLNFPLLVLQKNLETAYLQYKYGDDSVSYDVNYGETWAVSKPSKQQRLQGNSSTPCDWQTRDKVDDLGNIMPWVISFVFLLMSNISFQVVAEERRKHLFNSLRRLGLLDSAYWASWFITFQIMLILGGCIALVVGAIVRPHSAALRAISFDLMFLLIWLSGTAFTSMSFFLAAFCNTSSAAAAITFTEFLACLITISACATPLNSYAYISLSDDSTEEACYLITSSYNTIFSTTLTGNTFVQFLVFFFPWFHTSQAVTDMISEVKYKGQTIDMSGLSKVVQMSYSSSSPDTFDSKWISWSFTMLVSEVIIFMAFAWFAAQLLSSDGSEGRPLMSILLPQFVRDFLFTQEVIYPGDVRGIERERSRVDSSVRVYKVSKTFSGVQALKEVSFSLARGEVFVLLGHNGAGKSTLVNCLTGLTSPTHGKVFLNGLDIDHDVTEIQQSIGVCPQHDLLWDELTAREHMLLTAAFKGCVIGKPLLKAVDFVLGKVELLDRADDFASKFSGGMQRRLSVAMSTVGDVSICLFDEPTTGLDPLSRRRVEETINWMKKDRIVILTTHNMEEADYLADTIMIMHNGQVRAWGDPLYLKQTYGKGYHINMTVEPHNVDEIHRLIHTVLPNPQITNIENGAGTDENPVSSVVVIPSGGQAPRQQQQQAASRQLNQARAHSGMLQIAVPKGDMRGLPRLFAWLESSKRAKSIVQEWGVSNTTLEQVFLMLCEQNTQVNFAASSADSDDAAKLKACPMCRKRMKDTVLLRSLATGKAMVVAESLCAECSNGNPDFELEEDVVRTLLTETPPEKFSSEKAVLLQQANARSEASATALLLRLEAQEEEMKMEEVNWDEKQSLLAIEDIDESIAAAAAAEAAKAPASTAYKAGGRVGAGPTGSYKGASVQLPPEQVTITIPPNAPPGTRLQLTVKGVLINVTVPSGVKQGQKLKVNVPVSATENERTQSDDGVAPIHEQVEQLVPSSEDRNPSVEMSSLKPAAAQAPSAESYQVSPIDNGKDNTMGQIRAIMIKNLTLQSKQRCSNCCSVCFVGTMFLILYLLGLLFAGVSNVKQCSQGYRVKGYDCSTEELADHLFSGAAGNMVVYDNSWYDDDDNSIPQSGYNIQYALVPTSGYTGQVQTFGNTLNQYMSYGLPYNSNRGINIWSSFAESETLFNYLNFVGLAFNTREPPAAAAGEIDAPNSYMYGQQQEIFDAVTSDTSEYPYCEVYDPNTLIGSDTATQEEVQQQFSDNFADATYVCPTCSPSDFYASTDDDARTLFFDGTMWVSKSSGGNTYPYGFTDYIDSDTNGTSYYGNSCPSGFEYFSMEYLYGISSQIAPVMTYLNLLTNMLVDPSLAQYNIQGGVGQYGDLSFDAARISQILANFLTVIAMLLLNGFWPTAVWRLSHERSLNIVLMMRTVGMRAFSYVGSMFLFDMIISVVSGILMVVFAVRLKLSLFEDAPVGYLIAIVILSAWALNALSQLMVITLGKHSSILPMLAPCLLIASTAASTLLNVLVYPDEGDFPGALCLYPFFAQGRALYLILVYHRTSDEVDTALGLLFVVGFLSLTVVCVIESQLLIFHKIHTAIKKEYIKHRSARPIDHASQPLLTSTNSMHDLEKAGDDGSSRGSGGAGKQVGGDEEVGGAGEADNGAANSIISSSQVNSSVPTAPQPNYYNGVEELDADVQLENERAAAYVPTHAHNQRSMQEVSQVLSDDQDHSRLAIVIQKLSHCFDELSPRPVLAIDDLSLALSFGECFGLLGPNGAGKSTTMSVLAGTLRATIGEQYVAGYSLRESDSAINKYVGVCPQFDIVWPDLTVQQHLAFQARQRGIPEGRISAEVQTAALSVGLDGDGFYTNAGQLSGGMRRRLSIAMSIVGNPPVIYLDEPTTGLDPDNRQHVWKIIQNLKNPNRLILMTTHSMEEAEALCSRIGIMAKGRLRCVGSAQHLKEKFGKGYTLTINLLPTHMGPEQSAVVDNFVQEELGKSTGQLLSSINRTKKYLLLKSPALTISEIFRQMESNKEKLGIREWGLSMSTLEDVFITTVNKSHNHYDGGVKA